MVCSKSVKADVDAFSDSFGTEIKVRRIVAAKFGAKGVAVARYATQSDPEHDFAHATSVERRCVDEVQSALQGDLNTLQCFVQLHTAEFLPQ